MQGNILTGHGRDFSIQIFLRLHNRVEQNRNLLKRLSDHITSAYKQEIERIQYKAYSIPGGTFGNLFISSSG
ncbi:MAG TPA: peroxidase, partial [Candidatus Angelobacter sp.]|nr:peroxidase [Candidatus Angelobacter sp.]